MRFDETRATAREQGSDGGSERDLGRRAGGRAGWWAGGRTPYIGNIRQELEADASRGALTVALFARVKPGFNTCAHGPDSERGLFAKPNKPSS